MSKNKYPSEDLPEQSVGLYEPEEKVEATGDVTLVFKQNRSFELHIGGTIYRFDSHGQVSVPRSILTHKDFTEEIRRYFLIKEQ